MPKNNILEELRAKSREFDALPLRDRVRKNRETHLNELLGIGYLSKDEAKDYEKPIKSIPTDRKGLVVAYYLTGIENLKENTPTMGEADEIQRIIRSLPVNAHEALRSGGSLADGLTKDEEEETAERLTSVIMRGRLRRAESFVDTKRRRIRKQLLKFLTYNLCSSLLQKEKSIEPIPYLKDCLKELGYRDRAKSLNDADKKAIERAASQYLDLLELAFLSGEGLLRREEYKSLQDEEGRFKEAFYYRDITDEALLEFENNYELLELTFTEFYEAETAKEATDFVKDIFSKLRQSEELQEEEQLIRGSKFGILFKEG